MQLLVQFKRLPNILIQEAKLKIPISPAPLLQQPNGRQARLSVLSVVVMNISKLNVPIDALLLHLQMVLMILKVKRRMSLLPKH